MLRRKINPSFLVALLDLVMSLATEIVYGPFLSGDAVGGTLLWKIMPCTNSACIWANQNEGGKHLESVPVLSKWEGRGSCSLWLRAQGQTEFEILPLPLVSPGALSHKSLEGGSSLPGRGLGASSSCSVQASVIARSKCYPLGPQGLKVQGLQTSQKLVGTRIVGK